MDSLIICIYKVFYSLYLNFITGFYGLKYLYSVISVIEKKLSLNSKKWTLVLVHHWAAAAGENYMEVLIKNFHIIEKGIQN